MPPSKTDLQQLKGILKQFDAATIEVAMSRHFTIAGRIVRKKDGQGVHGLLVELCRSADRKAVPVGVSRTRADGAFKVKISYEQFRELFEKKQTLAVRVKDRDD